MKNESEFYWSSIVDRMRYDLRLATRALLKSFGFTSIIVLSLSLGIGANAAIFSVVDAILLRPLPVSHPEQMVAIDTVNSGGTQFGDSSYPDYHDFVERSRSFQGLVLFRRSAVSMLAPEAPATARPEFIPAAFVTGNFFSVLDIAPGKGRNFLPEEDEVQGRNPVCIISYGLWQRSFAGDPNIVGRSLTLNGISSVVVGIAPKSFTGVDLSFRPEVYIPVMMIPRFLPGGDALIHNRSARSFRILGRLPAGRTASSAQAEVNVIARDLQQQYPESNRETVVVVRKELDRRLATGGLALPAVLIGLVSFVLLIACSNAANLMMARAFSRLRELATQLAVGATRRRLIAQMLSESAILAVVSGALGVVLGYCGIRAAAAITPFAAPALGPQFQLDTRVVVYALVVVIATIFLCGLVPAFMVSREAIQAAIRTRTSAVASRSFGRVRQILIIGQVGLSVILLIASGLFVKSFTRAQTFDLGFDANNLLVVTFDLGRFRITQEQAMQFSKNLLPRVSALPGVRSASMAAIVPFLALESWDITVDGYMGTRGEQLLDVLTNRVDDRYFETMQISLLKGRTFTDHDTLDTPAVAVVNESFARKFIAGEGPLGKAIGHTIHLRDTGKAVEIVGVVKDSTYGMDSPIGAPPRPEFYLPLLQNPQTHLELHVRTATDPSQASRTILQSAQDINAAVIPSAVATMADIVSGKGLFMPRISAVVSSVFGLIALVLAVVGLYGIVSFMVECRKQEMAIRMALGSQKRGVLWMILRNSLTFVSVGLVAGIVGTVALAPLASNLLTTVSPWDPLTYILLPLSILAVTMIASWIPARRVTRLDPMAVLRYE